jgi:hypothetical protein
MAHTHNGKCTVQRNYVYDEARHKTSDMASGNIGYDEAKEGMRDKANWAKDGNDCGRDKAFDE